MQRAVHFMLTPIAAVALMLLAACGSSQFEVSYDPPVSRSVSSGWRVSDVRVAVPESLTVSEALTIAPEADIVWREDAGLDRKAQVAAIVRNAAQQAVAPMRGSRRVRLDIAVTRFHALTFEAEARLTNAGVHNINYVATIVDVATGTILAGPTIMSSDSPAFVGAAAREARASGATQKALITQTVRSTIAGWLGLVADPRTVFARVGL